MVYRAMANEDIMPRQLMGVITEDPLQGLPLEAKVVFSSDLFRPNPPAGLADVLDWDFFDGAVIGLHFGDLIGNQILPGSGVMVAPGVALVARHVARAGPVRWLAACRHVAAQGCEQ
jgi:hypothetical protein